MPIQARPALLALNAGSSSVKVGLFDAEAGSARAVGRGAVDLHPRTLVLRLEAGGERSEAAIDAMPGDQPALLEAMLAALAARFDLGGLRAVGHRVVHGGMRFHGPVRIDDDTLAAIDALTPMAPLHQPESLSMIRALRRLRPQLMQTASFDTAFHATQDDLASRFALPRAMHDEGIRRYGFHGLSYAYIAGALERRQPALAAGRVVVAHLGSGASACAMHGGRSVDTSMGFSTLDGLPMATRPGTLDPGVVLYLIEKRRMSVKEVEDLLYHRSGLLGVSGISADMRTLESDGGTAARQALDLFALRTAGEISRLTCTVGGLDAIVFTAGIGEHDAAMRAAICGRLGWLGVEIDAAANARHAELMQAPSSRVAVLVIPTDEEQVIADETLKVLQT
ncbi:MAG: acetate/propionate family kinase [Caldimonas sp.]